MRTNAETVLDSQLQTVARIWPDIRSASGPADRWLKNFFHRYRSRYGSRDRRFISEVLFSLFRNKTYLETLAGVPEGNCDDGRRVLMAAAAEGFLSEGQFQQRMTAGGKTENAAAEIYRWIETRRLPADRHFDSEAARLEVLYSFPGWLVRRWMGFWGLEKCESLLRASHERPDLVIRANPVKINRDELLIRLAAKGYDVSPTPISPWGILAGKRANLTDTEDFRNGLFEIQDEGSQILCEKIGAQAGDVIWDACAGGGGKSLFLAGLMHNKGRLFATDVRLGKLGELKKRAQKAGIFNIFTAHVSEVGAISEAKRGFDKILVDAPCSGTGTFRRNPDAKWRLAEEDFGRYRVQQTEILENALPFLKKGGRIFYATCSLEPDENEEVFKDVLAGHTELIRIDCGRPPGGGGYVRLFPDEHKTDGFFMAAAEKIV